LYSLTRLNIASCSISILNLTGYISVSVLWVFWRNKSKEEDNIKALGKKAARF
jgi:ABC-type glucose/galactose transport system permease subunit